jgi:hypothetical protein
LSVLIVIVLFTFFKGIIWLKLKDKKFSWKFFRKYLYLNLIYLIPSIIIIAFVFFKFKTNLVTIPVILILLHFHFLTTYFFIEENKIKKSLKQAFTKGFNINLFIGPYLVIGVGFVLIGYILGNIPFYESQIIVNSIVYIFYFSISRNYIKNIL